MAGVAQLPGQCIPIFVELHETHLEERQTEDLVLARGITQYVLRQQDVGVAALECLVHIGAEVALVLPKKAHRFASVLPHTNLGPQRAFGAAVLGGNADQVI
ncbi:hypothetical protein D9M71_293210 [compost metagenome]